MERMIKVLLIAIIVIGLLIGSSLLTTGAYFTDTEESTDNALVIATGTTTTLLDDGFEGEPWDANWDGNGTTDWIRTSYYEHSGAYCARSDEDYNGYLTSDNLNASAAQSITVSFWFRPRSVESGDLIVRLYDGSTYDNWWDLRDYPTFQDSTWCYFSEQITDSQYFISNFRIRFDSSAMGGFFVWESYRIDDVLITMESWS